MLVVPGSSALPASRALRLLAALRGLLPGATGLAARYVHLVDVGGALTPVDELRLRQLLHDAEGDPGAAAPAADGGLCFVVVPRVGTVSPWSSKATEIARVCGIDAVRRIERAVEYRIAGVAAVPDEPTRRAVAALLHDRMVEAVLPSVDAAAAVFSTPAPRPLRRIALGDDPRRSLAAANDALGLALAPDEIEYLAHRFRGLRRDPTDVELMMFAQANSEHCRHKIFNASWSIDGVPQERSLFSMIRYTHERHNDGVLSAYRDNAAVMAGPRAARVSVDADHRYCVVHEHVDLLMKVETHNHPTGIAPFAGAATGAGGEIRDEGATGRGGKPKAGLCGFTVSNLRIPGLERPWEVDHGRSDRMATPLDIMIEGPIGAAAFNNEFGRPNICGYFRTFEQTVDGPDGAAVRGFHKPIMLAGGIGNVRRQHVAKQPVAPGAPIVVLGGPAMLIGLGGGAASSMATGDSSADLDFASVQRANAEMQRRCQEVIDRCWALGDDNPIASIHDVGAGGLSNAVPEIVHDAGRGAQLDLAAIPNADPSLSPMEIWCNEAQERYVLALRPERLAAFVAIAERERAVFAVIGHATEAEHLTLRDPATGDLPIDLPMDVLFGKPPRMHRDAIRRQRPRRRVETSLPLAEAALRVLRAPTVASKEFLITIGDRTVTGMVARDPMVGPWQVPVADVAVTTTTIGATTGEAMAIGERPPAALIDPAASARIAVAESLTNIAAAYVGGVERVRLSANWMHPAGYVGEDAGLYDMVQAIAMDLCPKLGVCIPVGKDSMSMRASWSNDGVTQTVTSPTTLVVSAFATVDDVRRCVTPQLRTDCGRTDLLLVDLGRGRRRLGASIYAQVTSQLGDATPDVDDPYALKAFFNAVQTLLHERKLLAYHDRSDGGLFVTLCEMAFAGHVGVTVALDDLAGPGDADLAGALFAEELGAVLQVRAEDTPAIIATFRDAGLGDATHVLGTTNDTDDIHIVCRFATVLSSPRADWQRVWTETSHAIARLRDDATCADEAFDAVGDPADPGLSPALTFNPAVDPAAHLVAVVPRPSVAILREQGVNGQVEMAAAFMRAGFDAVDVHMSDVLGGRVNLARFRGLVACGGFSYGDVLGAGAGWARSILFHGGARAAFQAFFERPDTFALGVCNGCQMMSGLHQLIPGADAWPRFVRNRSQQFEARLSMVRVEDGPSVLLRGMAGARLPIAVAHGEGRASLRGAAPAVALRWVDNHGGVAQRYPANPNGSPDGIAGVTTADGRATIMMPHPERVFLTAQHSWAPPEWGEEGPWLCMFRNARAWVG